MPEMPVPDPTPMVPLEDLCDALQALGGYLSALRQGTRVAGNGYPIQDIIDKTLGQHARAVRAANRLAPPEAVYPALRVCRPPVEV